MVFRLYYDDISKVFSTVFRLHYDDILKIFRPFSEIVFETNPAILQHSPKNFGFNRNLWQIMQI